jgi:succinate dehydrogenase / fumarate reductase cytochrome b subunit
MMRWITKVLASSIGKKVLMGLTGVLLVLFLFEHIVGNLLLYVPGWPEDSFRWFDGYVAALQKLGPGLWILEIGLLSLILLHAIVAITVTLENREARDQKYVVRGNRGGQTLASISMIVTGLIVFVFLVKHALDFRFDEGFHRAHGERVAERMGDPLTAIIYLVVFVALALHLSHGCQSAMQSLGLHHPRWKTFIDRLGIVIAVVFTAIFASFPIYFLFFYAEGGAS